ncbi:MAG: cobalamin-dependent protein, partial [Elusimicrobiales bacterium]|nr:cobalamin-dependent protein [Elusimicrobiales bacterium]
MCMIAALAEKEGWKVQLIDAEIENLSNPEIIHRLKEFKPDLIGLTATTPFFASIADNAKVLKEHLNIPIIIGGPHISIFGEQAFLDAF